MTKRAVSISIGSSSRDKKAQLDLLGQSVEIERIGTDGDLQQAARLFRDLDGKVDAFGLGGTDLGLEVDGRYFPLHSVQFLVEGVSQTPVVDGSGLKHTLERNIAAFIEEHLDHPPQPKRVLITSAADRWGTAASFLEAGYECIFGDLMFALGLPLPIRSKKGIKRMAAALIPLVSRMPFQWLYPTGESQHEWTPKWGRYYRWASVIAGDCHYVKRYMPRDLKGKIVVTNTTTQADTDRFKESGVRYLVTSTPVIGGRSFGTNMMEAALVAAADLKRPLSRQEIKAYIERMGMRPQLQQLNR
jgi:hypothetical protein